MGSLSMVLKREGEVLRTTKERKGKEGKLSYL
jgi:hypothetical protein